MRHCQKQRENGIVNFCVDLDWPVIYSNLIKSSSDTKLKWFQYRILYRILTTNDYLYKRKVINTDRCTFCQIEKETTRHLLWDCTYTEQFWKLVIEWFTQKIVHARSLKITEQLVIFGVQKNFVSDSVLDLIILMAKYHIFRCRCLKVVPNFACFSKEVKQRAAVEKYIWLMKGNLTMYFSLWFTYFPLINDKD